MLSDLAARELVRSNALLGQANTQLAGSNTVLAYELKRLNDQIEREGGLGALLEKLVRLGGDLTGAANTMSAAANLQQQAAGSMSVSASAMGGRY